MNTGFRNITEVKRANKAIGHFWFAPDPVNQHRVETKIIGGHYWVESANLGCTGRRDRRGYAAVAADPNGAVSYLHGAERFPTLDGARAIIDAIVNNREDVSK